MGVQLSPNDELRARADSNQATTQSGMVGVPDSQIADSLSTASADGASQHGNTSAKSDQIAPTPTELHAGNQQWGQQYLWREGKEEMEFLRLMYKDQETLIKEAGLTLETIDYPERSIHR